MKSVKIFYYCNAVQWPCGGNKEVYRHVDILTACGYDAYVVHPKEGFRMKWFENSTKVIGLKTFARICNKKTDYVVFTETDTSMMSGFPGKKIIFNQGLYLGFMMMGVNKASSLVYLDKKVKFVMTVSRDSARCLKFIYPEARIRRIYLGIDSNRFTYRPLEEKKRAIAILIGKAQEDKSFFYHAISARAQRGLNKLGPYRWEWIGNLPERKVADILGKSLIFVFLSMHEGFPLMPLEAMLSGALVVAFKGGAHAEYLNSDNSLLLDPADKVKLIEAVEDIAERFESDRGMLSRIAKNGYITAQKYSLARENRSVLGFWNEVLHSEP